MRDGVKIISLFEEESYRKKFSTLEVLREEDLFLECRCYDVFISVNTLRDAQLNIFEETVLRLLGICGRSIEEIADLSCLEKDFVKAICTGLQKNNFITENNVLTDSGKNYLTQTALAENIEEQAVRIIALPDTGQLLKIVLQNSNYDYEGFFEGGKLSMILNSDDAGNETKTSGFFLHCPKEKFKRNLKIPQYKVKEIISEQNFNLAENYSLNISSSGSRVFLHLKCALQQGAVDNLIVSDGTDIISGTLVQYLRENYRDYLDKLNERAAKFQADISKNPKKFQNEKYFHVKENLDALKNFLDEKSQDATKINSELGKNNFSRLYAAVEHALNYYLQEYPVSTMTENLLRSQTPHENYRTLIKFAREINLYTEKKEILLSSLSKINLNAFKQNSKMPLLNVVLPLSIASGFENRLSPFAAAVKAMPNLLQIFYKVYLGRGTRHGSAEQNFSQENYFAVAQDVQKFIKLLLPDFQETDAQNISENFKIGISQERLNAMVELQNSLGSKIYYDANENLKNALISISPYYSGNKMLAPVDFVNQLYRCLENFIRTKTQHLPLYKKNISAVISELEKFLESPLPKTLKTVSERFFINAVKGLNSSLGAYTLAFFGFLPKDLLTDKISVKKNLETIAEILSLRQHANNTELNLTLTEKNLNSLREKTFDAIKFLEEF